MKRFEDYEKAYELCYELIDQLTKLNKESDGYFTFDIKTGYKDIALAHNHPSSNCFPSKSDDEITYKIQKACEIMRLYFMDHVIISSKSDQYYSYHDRGKL